MRGLDGFDLTKRSSQLNPLYTPDLLSTTCFHSTVGTVALPTVWSLPLLRDRRPGCQVHAVPDAWVSAEVRGAHGCNNGGRMPSWYAAAACDGMPPSSCPMQPDPQA